jgi:hypothetical protein
MLADLCRQQHMLALLQVHRLHWQHLHACAAALAAVSAGMRWLLLLMMMILWAAESDSHRRCKPAGRIHGSQRCLLMY